MGAAAALEAADAGVGVGPGPELPQVLAVVRIEDAGDEQHRRLGGDRGRRGIGRGLAQQARQPAGGGLAAEVEAVENAQVPVEDDGAGGPVLRQAEGRPELAVVAEQVDLRQGGRFGLVGHDQVTAGGRFRGVESRPRRRAHPGREDHQGGPSPARP